MNRCRLVTLLVLLIAASAKAAATTEAATTAALPKPDIAITIGEEEKKQVVRALVTLNGKPLEDATVTISVKRTFGNLPLGKDTTLDDGTAVAPFPVDLPGGFNGQLQFVANVAPTSQYGAAVTQLTLPRVRVMAKPEDAFPRALWAPHAPLPLLISVFSLLGGVWVTYVFVISQILAIARDRGSRRA